MPTKSEPHYCPECNGTGADQKKTQAMRKREPSSSGYVSCWNCTGNGLDPVAYFRWSSEKKEPSEDGNLMDGYSAADLNNPDGFSSP